MSKKQPEQLPWLVWKGGKATYVNGLDGFHAGDLRRPLPRVRCETCGELACYVVYEEIDLTEPLDEVRGFVPGQPHHFCKFHTLRKAVGR